MGTAIQKQIRQLSATYLIVAECFEEIEDHRTNKSPIPFPDFLKSAFAMMHQKYDSLLGLDKERTDKICCHNLEKLHQIEDGKVPSDTRMREVVDYIKPCYSKKPFKELFNVISS